MTINLLNHMLNVRIVEAVVNGIPLWRVYVNQNVEATLPSHEDAMRYARERTRFGSNCGSSMCRNGCTSMLNFNEPCAHMPFIDTEHRNILNNEEGN